MIYFTKKTNAVMHRRHYNIFYIFYVLPSDKSGPVAVMRATRYHTLGLDVLQDTDTFTQVDEDDEEALDKTVMQLSHNRQIRAILDRLGGDQDELYRRLVSPSNPQHPTMMAYP